MFYCVCSVDDKIEIRKFYFYLIFHLIPFTFRQKILTRKLAKLFVYLFYFLFIKKLKNKRIIMKT